MNWNFYNNFQPEHPIFSFQDDPKRIPGLVVIHPTRTPPPTASNSSSEESVGNESWGFQEDPLEWMQQELQYQPSPSGFFEEEKRDKDQPPPRVKCVTMERQIEGQAKDETIFVLNKDLSASKTDHWIQVLDAVDKNTTYILFESDRTSIDRKMNTWIRCGRHFYYTSLLSSYWTSFAAYCWPHLKWTWVPSFVVASVSFLGYQLYWWQEPCSKYQPHPKKDLLKQLPKDTFPAGIGIPFKLDKYRYCRVLHLHALYGWIVWNFIHYTLWPYPPTLCDWRCVDLIPKLQQKYS